MEYRGVKLQPWRQNGTCDLREGLGLRWTGVAGNWECEIERVDPGSRELRNLCRI